MRLYEYEAKALLARSGVEVLPGLLVPGPDAQPSAADLPPAPWVVKSQVLTGGRMKAGGVAFAETEEALRAASARLWELPIGGLRAVALLVEPRVAVTAEYYLGVTWDEAAGCPVLLASACGGVHVEAAAATVGRATLPVLEPLAEFRVRQALVGAGIRADALVPLARLGMALAEAFARHDLVLAEVNPLAHLADGRLVALDAHVEIDDDAVGRQRGLLQSLAVSDTMRQQRAPTRFEREAQAVDAADHRGVAGRVVEFGGSLGLVIGGGGASLAAFDAVRRHGGRPANYCEIGGNPSVAKVAGLVRLLLGEPRVDRIAVIMNVVSNTRSDLVARGVIRGILDRGRDPREVLAVFRVPGAGEAESQALLAAYGVEALGRDVSIDEAARRAVQWTDREARR